MLTFTQKQIKRAASRAIKKVAFNFIYDWMKYKSTNSDEQLKNHEGNWRSFISWFIYPERTDEIETLYTKGRSFAYYFIRNLGGYCSGDTEEDYTQRFSSRMEEITKFADSNAWFIKLPVCDNRDEDDVEHYFRVSSFDTSESLLSMEKDENRKEKLRLEYQKCRENVLKYRKWLIEAINERWNDIDKSFKKVFGEDYKLELVDYLDKNFCILDKEKWNLHLQESVEFTKEDEGFIVTDPCYIDDGIENPNKDYGFFEYMNRFYNEGGKGIYRDTLYGDWSAGVFDEETHERLGKFCADSGMVCILSLKDMKKFNPKFLEWVKEHNWCCAVVEGFVGKAKFTVQEVPWSDEIEQKYRSWDYSDEKIEEFKKYYPEHNLLLNFKGTLNGKECKLIGGQTGF